MFSIEEFKTNIGRNSRLLGVDPGKKNIGIAICDENQIVATPLKIIHKNKFEILVKELKESFSAICKKLCKEINKIEKSLADIEPKNGS